MEELHEKLNWNLEEEEKCGGHMGMNKVILMHPASNQHLI